MSLFLSKFTEYNRLLHLIISHTDPLRIDSITRLFCIRQDSIAKYGLGIGSFLHRSATRDRNGRFSNSKKSVITLSKNEVVLVLRKYLAEYLRERVLEENEFCRKAPVFSQYPYVVNSPQGRVEPEDFRQYNLRLGIHLQQINILQSMFPVHPYPLLRKSRTTMYVMISSCSIPNPTQCDLAP